MAGHLQELVQLLKASLDPITNKQGGQRSIFTDLRADPI